MTLILSNKVFISFLKIFHQMVSTLLSVIQFKKNFSCLEFYLLVIDRLDLPQMRHLLIEAKMTVFKAKLTEQFLWLVFIWCIKAPQNVNQLREIHQIYKQTLDFEVGGCMLKKVNGTCWISHKLEAMKMCLDKWSLYIEQLEHLSSYKSIPSKDKQKLIGCLEKWKQGRLLLMLAMLIDVSENP